MPYHQEFRVVPYSADLMFDIVADVENHAIRKIDIASQVVTTIGGNGLAGYSDTGKGQFHNPNGVALDSLGNVYIADQSNHRIRKVNSDGIITTIAGNGIDTFSGDGGPATLASLSYPQGVTIGNAGDIFIADWGNGRIRRIDSSGIISTVAGTDASGIWGDCEIHLRVPSS